jgi:hypothetical protein
MKHLYVWVNNESGIEKTLGANEVLNFTIARSQGKKSVKVLRLAVRWRGEYPTLDVQLAAQPNLAANIQVRPYDFALE